MSVPNIADPRDPRKSAGVVSFQDVQQLLKAIRADSTLTPATKFVAGTILEFLNRKDGRCFPSHETIAAECGVHRRTVERAVAALEAAGWVTAVRTGRSNRYHFAFDRLAEKPSNVIRLADRTDTPPVPIRHSAALTLETNLKKEESKLPKKLPEKESFSYDAASAARIDQDFLEESGQAKIDSCRESYGKEAQTAERRAEGASQRRLAGAGSPKVGGGPEPLEQLTARLRKTINPEQIDSVWAEFIAPFAGLMDRVDLAELGFVRDTLRRFRVRTTASIPETKQSAPPVRPPPEPECSRSPTIAKQYWDLASRGEVNRGLLVKLLEARGGDYADALEIARDAVASDPDCPGGGIGPFLR